MASAQNPHFDSRANALFLDVDGTLLDLAARPEQVRVSGRLKRTLAKLSTMMDGAIALLSGRPLSQIDSLFAPFHPAAAGCHGAELRLAPDAPIIHHAPLPADARQAFMALADRAPGVQWEDKCYSLALHYRLDAAQAAHFRAQAEELARQFLNDGVELLEGKSVIEAKPRGYDKGSAFARLMTAAPFLGRKPLFSGDDVTDEHVFARLGEYDGTGISVGRKMEHARYRMESPEEVRQWLESIAQSA